MNRIEYIGIIAGSFSVMAGVIQLYRIYKSRSSKDISLIALIGGIISTIIWIYYHYVKNDRGPIITSSLVLIFLSITLILKIYYNDKSYNGLNYHSLKI